MKPSHKEPITSTVARDPYHFYKTRAIEEWLRGRERAERRVGGGTTQGRTVALLIKEWSKQSPRGDEEKWQKEGGEGGGDV